MLKERTRRQRRLRQSRKRETSNRGASDGRVKKWQFSPAVVLIRAALILGLMYPVMAVFSRRRTYGRERLDSVEGPVIFAANHLSVADNPAVLLALPWRRRMRLATAASEGVMRNRGRFQTFLATLISNGFLFSQRGSVRSSLEDCEALIHDGWSLLFFPEGIRSDDGKMRPFKPGIGLLATRLGVPVVPVHIKGTDSVISKGGSRPQRGRIEVSFGHALRIPADTEYYEAAAIVREAIVALGPEAALLHDPCGIGADGGGCSD